MKNPKRVREKGTNNKKSRKAVRAVAIDYFVAIYKYKLLNKHSQYFLAS